MEDSLGMARLNWRYSQETTKTEKSTSKKSETICPRVDEPENWEKDH